MIKNKAVNSVCSNINISITYLKVSFRYRYKIIFDFISTAIPIFIALMIWIAIYDNGMPNNIYTLKEMVIYVVSANVLYKTIEPDFYFDIADSIQSGRLSILLVKPIKYYKYLFYKKIGEKIQIIVLTIIVTILCNVIVSDVDIVNYLFFLIVSILGYVLFFQIAFLLSCVNFWVIDGTNIYYTMFGMFYFLSGTIIPVSFFPYTYRLVQSILPFKYLINFNLDVLLGKMSSLSILKGVGIQITWILILYLLIEYTFNNALQRYESLGG